MAVDAPLEWELSSPCIRMVDVLIPNPATMTTWVPTAYRTHTLGQIQSIWAELVGKEVKVAGFLEANRGK